MARRFVLPGLKLLAGLAVAAPWIACAAPAQAEAVLERVVLVQRHGVRAPTQSAETLADWSPRAWPRWPAERGHLTARGAQVVALVAGGVRDFYVKQGLLSGQGCPGSRLVVWADGKDQRTRDSGREMAQTLAPGCGVAVQSGAAGVKDPVFDSLGASCLLDPAAGEAALRAAVGEVGLVDPGSLDGIRRICRILKPGSPPIHLPNTIKVMPEKMHIDGPLAMTGDVGEIFLLEYAQDMPAGDVAWGEAATPAALDALMGPRNRLAELTRRLPYVAQRQGAGMARLMLSTLAGEPHAAAPAVGADVKLLALAGHDDNLSNMAGVFDVDWILPAQPDATAPATAFALERWRDTVSGTVTVSLRLFYAELEGMRRLEPSSVRALAVPLPDCGPKGCPLEALRDRILATLPEACGR